MAKKRSSISMLSGVKETKPAHFGARIFFGENPDFFAGHFRVLPDEWQKMSDILTISLLETLSKPELTALGKYLKSPFFTQKRHLYPLFLELRRSGCAAAQKPAAHFAQIFPNESFNGRKWNKALSDLNVCIRDFLTVSHLLENQDLYNQAFVGAISTRLDKSVWQRSLNALLEQTSKSDVPDQADYWQWRFWSKKRVFSHPLYNRIKLGPDTFDELDEYLDIYYFVSKTQVMCNRVVDSRILRFTNNPSHLFQRWLETVRMAAIKSPSPLLQVYCELLALLLDAGVDLPLFFSALQQHAPYLHRDELRDIVRMAFSDCVQRQRKGDPEAFAWHIRFYLWSSEQGLWSAPYGEDMYLNIGVLIARAGMQVEFDRHLNAGQEIIPSERQAQAKDLLRAHWAFSHGNYAEAQQYLARISSRHPRYTLMRHSLSVRNNYMLLQEGYIIADVLKRGLDSFGDFLRHQDIFSESLVASYKNLIWFIRQLMRTVPDRKAHQSYLRQESNTRQSAARLWLEAVITQMSD